MAVKKMGRFFPNIVQSDGCVWSPAYLVRAGKAQPVEDGYEDVSRDEKAQEVGAAQEPVLRPKGVDFGRRPQNGHGRLERGEQRQRHGKPAHGAVGHQELLEGIQVFGPGSGFASLPKKKTTKKKRKPTCVVRWRPPEKA